MGDVSYALNVKVKHEQAWVLGISNNPESWYVSQNQKHYLIMDHDLANFNFLEKVTINIPINGVYVHDYGLLFVYPTVRM